ncbi:MAG TPA: SDR family NAD(P)-dependent oxidoreductase [Terracidiphilus sp.]|nr:SDR family NAD(P)-dependent oxidoreductase [Terracidiphilus sp.]
MKPTAIAIVGMAGRFPGARNVSRFWQNLHDGLEAIRDCPDAELLAAGATNEDLADAAYVKRVSVLDDVPLFDAGFFGFSPRDASIMDPQHRHFLECAWEALEDAAHPPQSYQGSIGVFAGSGMNTYLIHNLLANRRMLESAGLFQLKQTGNDKDVLATRVSYQFDLRGPSINVQTACSTSLVAVHLACQSLLNYECDMALAGGVTIEVPCGLGYVYREGEILSRDGHCRSFDASSTGTVFGNGLGIVVLRRLEDALVSHDQIRAVILGSAINNDGARKVGYLAPSVEGQVEVIEEALEFAGVRAEEISYVETHGTGTIVGDPIEIRALKQAFQSAASRPGSCGIGSVKSSVGHLDAAAGITGLIKTVLALEHAQLPATLHFEKLNPHIDLNGSPFYINDRLRDWPSNGLPRRAAVTALGIGGTNAHVILEAPPAVDLMREDKPCELLTVSAKSEAAADLAVANLVAHIQTHPELCLADVAFTCQQGRQAFAHRRALVVENSPDAIAALGKSSIRPSAAGVAMRTEPKAAFLFSGQGSQHVSMGKQLYQHEPVFRDALERCARLLQPHVGINLIEALYPEEQNKDAASEQLSQTWLTQPALFAIEYALAQWWISLGIEPAAMLGHSIGEYVAACLAGVFSIEDALAIVALRGRLIYGLPAGTMLAVPAAADKIEVPASLSIAAMNAPELSVVSGPTDQIAEFEQHLAQQSITCRRLHTSHAFHSAMMEPILAEFEQRLRSFTLRAPQRRYLSNVSGTWITPEEATDPAYWARHIRQTVRFAGCLAELSRDQNLILIEAGPGNALTSLARAQGKPAKAYQTLPHPRETISDLRCAMQTVGQLWTAGAAIDWTKLHADGSVQRVSLPAYPFEHQRYWVDPDRVVTPPAPAAQPSEVASGGEDGVFLYRRTWNPASLQLAAARETGSWLVFRDALGLGDAILGQLNADNRDVIVVDAGSRFRRAGRRHYVVRPGMREDYDALFSDIGENGLYPREIVHLWSVTGAAVPVEQALERSFYSPLYLAQALGAKDVSHARILFVSNQLQDAGDDTLRDPARAVLLGPARVIPKELPGITCCAVDVDFDPGHGKVTAGELIAEMNAMTENGVVAYRGGKRLVEALAPFDLASGAPQPHIERGGVYLITGGLGGVGLAVAEHLARSFGARLILLGRTAVPPEQEWTDRLADKSLKASDRQLLEKLVEIRRLAGGLLVTAGDVSKLDDLRGVIALAHKRYGEIDGVFHAAGVLRDGPLLLKTNQDAADVLNPKVQGTLALEEAFRDQPLHCFVLFSSISSIRPPAGQIDYAAANAFLDAFALSRKGSVLSLNWDAWRDVGMAARSSSPHPLLGARQLEEAGNHVYANRISTSTQWLLAEHRLKDGKALVPGTGYLEMAAGAFARATFSGRYELSNVLFLAPLAVGDSEAREIRIELRREESGGAPKGDFAFSIFAHDGQWIEHASGRIAPCLTSFGSRINRASIEERCRRREVIFDEEHRTKQERYFNFGPRWHCLRWLRAGATEALAMLELDARFHGDLAEFRMHPAILDLATGCSLYLNEWYDANDALFLPFSYKRLRVFRSIPARVFSHIRPAQPNRAEADLQVFNLTLFDEEGEGIAEVEGFTMRRMSDAARASEAARQSADAGARQPLAILSKPAISLREGTETLTRILNTAAASNVIIAAAPLREESARALPEVQRATLASESDQSIEETLSQWFRELLGLEKVDLDDDFFAMGGHSLIGVRLFAKIQNTYKVNLELALLFEARTVRSLAAKIHQKMGPAASPSRQWSFLVPIQPKGSKTPLFLLHAIGGEVLFYEPLARALGPDQPLYAVQSLLTKQMRETSIEELASNYLAEIRSFLPQGPYLLGGHSYGGLVAFEMARQLRAQGIETALLVMIDAVVPGSQHSIDRSHQWSSLVGNLRESGFSYLTHKASLKREYLAQKLLHRLNVVAGAGYLKLHRPMPSRLRYELMEELHRMALDRYVFTPFDGKITLLRATDRGISLSESDDPLLGWGSLARGGVEALDVPADHSNVLLEPQAAFVAEKLKQVLARGDKKPVEPQVAV